MGFKSLPLPRTSLPFNFQLKSVHGALRSSGFNWVDEGVVFGTGGSGFVILSCFRVSSVTGEHLVSKRGNQNQVFPVPVPDVGSFRNWNQSWRVTLFPVTDSFLCRFFLSTLKIHTRTPRQFIQLLLELPGCEVPTVPRIKCSPIPYYVTLKLYVSHLGFEGRLPSL